MFDGMAELPFVDWDDGAPAASDPGPRLKRKRALSCCVEDLALDLEEFVIVSSPPAKRRS